MSRHLLDTASAVIEYEVHGTGAPVTVYAHGLGGSIEQTRPFSRGVVGTAVLLHFRAHGATHVTAPADWDYRALAGDLRAVADKCAARAALGISMGAGALQRLLSETPDRFDRAVFLLPGSLRHDEGVGREDQKRRSLDRAARLGEIADLVAGGDLDALALGLAAELPPGVRESGGAARYLAARARALSSPGMPHLLRGLAGSDPVASPQALRAVRAQCLVLGAEQDPVHPAEAARQLAASLGPTGAPLHIFPQAAPRWTARPELRERITAALNSDPTGGGSGD